MLSQQKPPAKNDHIHSNSLDTHLGVKDTNKKKMIAPWNPNGMGGSGLVWFNLGMSWYVILSKLIKIQLESISIL